MVHVSPVSRTFEKDLNANFQVVDALEKSTNDRFHQNNIRWEKSDAEFQLLRQSIEHLDEKVERLDKKVDKQGSMMMWVMGFGFVVLSTLITVFGLMNSH